MLSMDNEEWPLSPSLTLCSEPLDNNVKTVNQFCMAYSRFGQMHFNFEHNTVDREKFVLLEILVVYIIGKLR